jgi:competence protein ComEC
MPRNVRSSLGARRARARILTTLVLLLVSVAPRAAADEPLRATFLDVGQGDAILVACPDGEPHLLIDSGDTRYPGSASAFKEAMNKVFEHRPKKLDVVVASHPHTDHIGSMKWVLENFEVGTYVDNGQKVDTTIFGDLEKVRRKLTKSGKLTYVNGRQTSFTPLDLCPDVTLELIEPWAVQPSLSDTNDRSVAVRLTYKKTAFLFVGDIHEKAEKVMLNGFDEQQRADLNVDVLKVGHHGSDTSSSPAFIQAVSPVIAVVSCGKRDVGTNAGYKHPRVSTVRAYDDWFAFSAAEHPPNGAVWAYDADQDTWRSTSRRRGLWVTTKDGTVTVESDGMSVVTVGSP